MRNLYTEVSDRIVAQLEAGCVPWVKPWRPVRGGNTPCNATTGNFYNGCNVILLWMACASSGFATPRFLTFKQAKGVGGNVKAGEHGTKIYFVSRMIKKNENGEIENKYGFLKEYTVFNVDQCENLSTKVAEGEAVPVKTVAERNADADDFVTATKAKVNYGGDRACYIPTIDIINMPKLEAFNTADNFYATTFHELAHWTGHKSRLDRDLLNRFGDNAYVAEELVAELTSAFVCAEFGFEGKTQHAEYIATWIKVIKDDPKAIFTAANKATGAATYLRELALKDASPSMEEEMAEAA